MRTFARLYGDNIFHLVILLAALALAAYTVSVLGVKNLFNPTVWWQSIAVWFVVAIIAHDLILFPLYTLAHRLIPGFRNPKPRHVHYLNYVRIPTLAAGLLLLMFLPGIIEQGAPSYLAATGLTQEPFLARWLLITAAIYLTSALCYIARAALQHSRSTEVTPEPQPD